MSFTVNLLQPGETEDWTLKIRTANGLTQVGTSGGTAGTYDFDRQGTSSLFKSVAIGVGAEPGAVVAGIHIFELFAPLSTEPDRAVKANVVDGTDIDLGAIPVVATVTTDLSPILNLLSSGAVVSSFPVTSEGELNPIVIADDYKAANNRAFSWTFPAIAGFTTAATGKFGIKNPKDVAFSYISTTGVVTDIGGGLWKVSFDIIQIAAAFPSGDYDWSVEIALSGVEITIIKSQSNRQRVALVSKQT